MYWTEKEIKILKRNYIKLGPTKLRKILLNRTVKAIQHKAQKFNLTINKISTYNENYFKTTDGNEPFIAGFIAADGCILDKTSGQNILQICLAEQDLDILRFIKKELNFSGNITNIKDKNPNRQNRVCLKISSNILCNDLKKIYKITPRKTFTLVFPNLKTDQEKIKFLSGIFAGDGSARKTKYAHFKITSASKVFIKKVSKEILRLINYSGDRTYICKDETCWIFQLNSENAESWFNLMKKTNFKKVPKRKWNKI